MKLKKLSVLCAACAFCLSVFFFAGRLNAAEKIKTNISGFVDVGYYSPENSDKSFIIDNAGLSFGGEKSELSALIEINYKDSEDTYFFDDMLYLNKIAITVTQKNGGAIIGKFPNLSLPRQSDVWSRKTLSSNIIDISINKHNPVGLQYYINADKINFSIAYLNGFGFTAAPVFPNSNPELPTLCQNQDYKKNGKNDIFASLAFKSGSGFYLKTGAMFSSLSKKDLAELNALSALAMTEEKKKMWYFSLEQSSNQMYFSGTYYQYKFSEIKNNIIDLILSYKLNNSLILSGSFSQINYNDVNTVSIVLTDRKQYTASLAYETGNLLIGYEYVVNKENLPDNSPVSSANDIHSMKAIYKF